MKTIPTWLSLTSSLLTLSVINGISSPVYAADLVSTITIPGNATDLPPLNAGSGGANVNRLGGFFSDLYYDRYNNVYYGLADRGPGGGTISYDTRVQKFTLDVDFQTGAISNFNLRDTIRLTNPSQNNPAPINTNNYNGLNPLLLNGNVSILGLSLDSEGLVVAPNGNFYVSDEYGPSVYEYAPDGTFLRAFTTPENIIPLAGSNPNYVDGRGTITSGRQDNRGFEGLAISPDGTKLFAMLQDPLVNEGQNTENGNNDGRYSRNLRIVEFDTATGNSTAQYIYQLEALASINASVPNNKFNANQQGRSIGISALAAINDHEFLVIERDNRGIGVDPPASPTEAGVLANPVATKKVYKIDLTGATNVKDTSLAGINTLPLDVTPVKKSLFLDIQDELKNAKQIIPEKEEGLAIGPQLKDGSYAIIIGTDNDFSVTQDNPNNIQTNVCTNLTDNSNRKVPLNEACPDGLSLIPTYLYSFKKEVPNFVPPERVPEPSAVGGLLVFGLSSFWLKRHRQRSGN